MPDTLDLQRDPHGSDRQPSSRASGARSDVRHSDECRARQRLNLAVTDALGGVADGPQVLLGAGFPVFGAHGGSQAGGECGALPGAGLGVPAVSGFQQRACAGSVTGAVQDVRLGYVGQGEQPSVSGELGAVDRPLQRVGRGRVTGLLLGASQLHAMQRGRPAEAEPVCRFGGETVVPCGVGEALLCVGDPAERAFGVQQRPGVSNRAKDADCLLAGGTPAGCVPERQAGEGREQRGSALFPGGACGGVGVPAGRQFGKGFSGPALLGQDEPAVPAGQDG